MNNHIPVFILKEIVILPSTELKIDLTSESSKKIIKIASKTEPNEVLVIAPKNGYETDPSLEDLPQIGVIATIKTKLELSNGKMRVTLQGKERVQIDKYLQNVQNGILKCNVTSIDNIVSVDANSKATKRKLITLLKDYISKNKNITNSILRSVEKSDDLSQVTDIIASFMPFSFNKKFEYMIETNPFTRSNMLINDLNEEINISNIDKELDEKLEANFENSQREYILREKLKEINNELGNTKDGEILALENKIDELNLNKHTTDKLKNEIKKYSATSEYSPESAVIKNYLDTVLSLPWHKSSKQNDNIKEISNLLNETHYGLEEIKERIIEYVELKKNNSKLRAPIICLIGPPGVGKTSIAMSIAASLNREFYKLSVGGLNDSTELIGTRKTYLGAAPGKVIQAILKCKVNNPLILIDEVDKMVKDYKGDPASTMLEILDETQNDVFVDNYIEEPFDISNVMFILTANDIDKIPATLLDRLEIINLDSYTISEKVDIAKNYLLKEILGNYHSELKINRDVIEYIVVNYTKEPGVRELKKVLEKLVRKVIVYDKDYKSITTSLVNKYLGEKKINYLPKIRDYGVCNTLAYTKIGGQISHVEVTKYKGTGNVLITGSVGNVLSESVKVVLSFLAAEYEIDIKSYDVHVHFIETAQKKDGPSAGVSIASAILSCFQRRLIDGNIAFTGEITLKGEIMPVGSLKEKLEAASSMGIKTVYIPKANENDLNGIPMHIFDILDVKMVSNFSEIYDALFR